LTLDWLAYLVQCEDQRQVGEDKVRVGDEHAGVRDRRDAFDHVEAAGHEHQDERDKDKAVAVASRCSGCFTSGWCSGRHHDGLPRRNREILGLQSVRAVSDLPSPFWTDSGEDGHPADGYVQ